MEPNEKFIQEDKNKELTFRAEQAIILDKSPILAKNKYYKVIHYPYLYDHYNNFLKVRESIISQLNIKTLKPMNFSKDS